MTYNPDLDVTTRQDYKGRTVYECKTERTARQIASHNNGATVWERGLNKWEVTCK